MKEEALYLDFYGIKVTIFSNSLSLIGDLKRRYLFFESHAKTTYDIEVIAEIGNIPYKRVPPVKACMYSLGVITYKKDGVRYRDYSGRRCLSIMNYRKKKIEIFSNNDILLKEKTSLEIISTVGYLLDKRRLHRIHAFGLSKNDRSFLCLVPMAAGKTTLSLLTMKQDKDIKLISDDICLIDAKGQIYPFPSCVAIRDKNIIKDIPEQYVHFLEDSYYMSKYLIDLAYFEGRIASVLKVNDIILGECIFTNKAEIKKIAKYRIIIPFLKYGVFGLGLPQIIELFLRSDLKSILGTLAIALSRSLVVLKVIIKSNTYRFTVGRDFYRNAEVLAEFINKRS